MAKRPRSKGPKGLKGQLLSLMVIRRIEDTMELVASIKSYTPRLEAAFVERYAPNLCEGETLPDYALALELTARDVKVALGHLLELDDAVAKAAKTCLLVGRDRSGLVDELYDRAVAVRGAIDLAFGRAGGRLVHAMKGRTERKAPPSSGSCGARWPCSPTRSSRSRHRRTRTRPSTERAGSGSSSRGTSRW